MEPVGVYIVGTPALRSLIFTCTPMPHACPQEITASERTLCAEFHEEQRQPMKSLAHTKPPKHGFQSTLQIQIMPLQAGHVISGCPALPVVQDHQGSLRTGWKLTLCSIRWHSGFRRVFCRHCLPVRRVACWRHAVYCKLGGFGGPLPLGTMTCFVWSWGRT